MKAEDLVGKTLVCHTTGYMENNGKQFCTKGKEYEIFQDEDTEDGCFSIRDERNKQHDFCIPRYKDWFHLKYPFVPNNPSKKRKSENWHNIISPYKFIRCTEDDNCLEVEKGVWYNIVTDMVYKKITDASGKEVYTSVSLKRVPDKMDDAWNIDKYQSLFHVKDSVNIWESCYDSLVEDAGDTVIEDEDVLESGVIYTAEGNKLSSLSEINEYFLPDKDNNVQDSNPFSNLFEDFLPTGKDLDVLVGSPAGETKLVTIGESDNHHPLHNVCHVPVKSTGGKSSYYKVDCPQWFIDKVNTGSFMVEDLAEIMYGNNFNYTNILKAQKRMYELEQGGGKEGNSFEYDATKCKYYVDKQVEVFKR